MTEQIAIVGTGLMGRLVALFLLAQDENKKAKITFFDEQGSSGINSCGRIAAGMLSPFSELEIADPLIFKMGMRSLSHWRYLAKQLDMTEIFNQMGSIFTAHPQDKPQLDAVIKRINDKADVLYNGKYLDKPALRALEPSLTQLSSAYYFPEEGHINTRKFFNRSTEFFRSHNITWHTHTRVTHCQPQQVLTAENNRTINTRFDCVFDCRGLGAKNAIAGLRGVRGEIIEIVAKSVSISRPVRLWHPRYRLYIVPREDHHYLLGASEIESEDMSPISVRSTLELLSAAASIYPDFLEARVLNSAVHCRPVMSNHLPQVEHKKGLVRVNGLYRHGYLIGPAVAINAIHCFRNEIETRDYYGEHAYV